MNAWLVRGLGMALVHFVARTLLALAIAAWPTSGSILRIVTMVVVILVAVVWGGIDGINDRRANPDPDYSADLTMVWLKASVVAGLLSGAVTWIVSAVSPIAITANSFIFEITSGAAFTILLVFVPTILAVGLGRLLAGRDAKKNDDDPRPSKKSSKKNADDRELVGAGAQSEYSRPSNESSDAEQSDADTEQFEQVKLQKDDERSTTWQEPKK
ncbi:B-4DMT family transporter [Actinomycetes bacterium M1A6_2h]